MKKILMLLFSVLVLSVTGSHAQNDNAILEKLLTEDSIEINALVLYPDSTRRSILEVSQYPEVLLKMQSLQESTQKDFNGGEKKVRGVIIKYVAIFRRLF